MNAAGPGLPGEDFQNVRDRQSEKPLILMYHRVTEVADADRYALSARDFGRQMRHLRDGRYSVIALPQLIEWCRGVASIPDRSIVITFDDGFLDTYEYAGPVLKDLGFSATFFVITDLIGKTNTWMTGQNVPVANLMDWREVDDLKKRGFEIGSHTANHRDLTEISPKDAREEIERSKNTLEDRLGGAVKFFAYPYGRYGERERKLVKEAGYWAACATSPGFVVPMMDCHKLNRMEVRGTDSLRRFSRKVRFGFERFTSADLIRYYISRLRA